MSKLAFATEAVMDVALQEKRERLAQILRECESVAVGYSGGVDSVFLARLATELLGAENVLAVTGKSDSLASWMEDTAREVAERFGIPWMELETEEMADPRYTANPSNRCYYCKTELWGKLQEVARARGLRVVVDGSNADDVGDHRPGALAAREHGVRSPLLEAGLTKAEIREWSRELGLPTWDQPAAPCLSSRIPYGLAVTPERLRQIEAAEGALRQLGLRDFRVRHHGEVARLEVHPSELPRLLAERRTIAQHVREAGFERVLLDLEGYRRGALNEGLAAVELVQLGSA
ncbi:MAG TPA: ATP-dependent sacrificial sulfur transferase LarE [Longimicrobiaceae bacterium]|nr:ATP-dependent sacrificial sulfur transferase LarE [Longimicrobiaceae bacterium]